MQPAPVIIDYQTFLQNANPDDVYALAMLSNGEVIRTNDDAVATVYEEIGVRLFNAGVVSRFRRSIEVIGDTVWHVFDGRVVTQAMVYLADAAKAYVAAVQAQQP